MIWDNFDTTDFPTRLVRVYTRDALWFIAYADDLAVISLSPLKLESVLNKLSSDLKHLNLLMRLIFVFCCLFHPPQSRKN
jgi:hypothetical protein